MDKTALLQWKLNIATYQQRVRSSQPEEQSCLFEPDPLTATPNTIDPFYLKLNNFCFFEWPASKYPSKPCIYFVIDVNVPLILYIGETCKANQRWKGVHDCKRYVLNYRELHFKHDTPTAINTTFYWDAPIADRLRLWLEAGLITRWRSPFNKENWHFWGTPFIGNKP
ncbi:MAG: GIY-YIG nuclease family protein [Cyanothece sp. SIO1E1]|nr:GIY-YIG nuclease family protein [Cyanothece sp. SIO1E1]